MSRVVDRIHWEKDNIQYQLIKLNILSELERARLKREGLNIRMLSMPDYYCGYCKFPKRPVKQKGYRGILTYVPVHGGITYAEGSEYGFDCNHVDDENNPDLQDIAWLKHECERMAYGIKKAAKYEKWYNKAKDSMEKALVLTKFHNSLVKNDIKFELTNNFGAMIELCFGLEVRKIIPHHIPLTKKKGNLRIRQLIKANIRYHYLIENYYIKRDDGNADVKE